jgi:hypothetical protein
MKLKLGFNPSEFREGEVRGGGDESHGNSEEGDDKQGKLHVVEDNYRCKAVSGFYRSERSANLPFDSICRVPAQWARTIK